MGCLADVLWGLLFVLQQTHKKAYLAFLIASWGILLAVLGYLYFARH
jgi:hypothetical protein